MVCMAYWLGILATGRSMASLQCTWATGMVHMYVPYGSEQTIRSACGSVHVPVHDLMVGLIVNSLE